MKRQSFKVTITPPFSHGFHPLLFHLGEGSSVSSSSFTLFLDLKSSSKCRKQKTLFEGPYCVLFIFLASYVPIPLFFLLLFVHTVHGFSYDQKEKLTKLTPPNKNAGLGIQPGYRLEMNYLHPLAIGIAGCLMQTIVSTRQ